MWVFIKNILEHKIKTFIFQMCSYNIKFLDKRFSVTKMSFQCPQDPVSAVVYLLSILRSAAERIQLR